MITEAPVNTEIPVLRRPIPSRRWPRNGPAGAVALLVAVLLGSLACTPPENGTAGAGTDSATIRIGTFASFETPNDLIAGGSQFNFTIVRQLFASLAREVPEYSAERPVPMEPELAESWATSEDGLQITFSLRDDAFWSDGTPVSASDVVFTHEAATSPDVGWVFADGREGIVAVEELDQRTVRFTFDEANERQLLVATEGVILPAHVWGQLPFDQWRAQPQWFLENLVTSGPFVLDDWQRQQRIVLRRYDRYFGEVGPERVVFDIVPDETNLFLQFEAGAVDMIYGVRPADVPRLRAMEGVEVVDFATRQYNFLSWNLERPQFRDEATRRGLAYAIDRQALVDTLWYGYATVADSPIVSWFWAHNDELEPLEYDPAEARRLFEQAGWLDSDGDGVREREGEELRFEITTNPGNQTRWDALTLMRAQLAEVGVQAELRQIEFNTLNAMNLAHDYDASLVAFAMDTSLDLSFAFHSDAIDGGYNFGSYSNPEIDALIDEANDLSDAVAKREKLLQVQQILHQEQPLLFLWEPRGFVAVRNGLTNVEPNALNEFANLTQWRKGS